MNAFKWLCSCRIVKLTSPNLNYFILTGAVLMYIGCVTYVTPSTSFDVMDHVCCVSDTINSSCMMNVAFCMDTNSVLNFNYFVGNLGILVLSALSWRVQTQVDYTLSVLLEAFNWCQMFTMVAMNSAVALYFKHLQFPILWSHLCVVFRKHKRMCCKLYLLIRVM